MSNPFTTAWQNLQGAWNNTTANNALSNAAGTLTTAAQQSQSQLQGLLQQQSTQTVSGYFPNQLGVAAANLVAEEGSISESSHGARRKSVSGRSGAGNWSNYPSYWMTGAGYLTTQPGTVTTIPYNTTWSNTYYPIPQTPPSTAGGGQGGNGGGTGGNTP